jgi:hypothetical protein
MRRLMLAGLFASGAASALAQAPVFDSVTMNNTGIFGAAPKNVLTITPGASTSANTVFSWSGTVGLQFGTGDLRNRYGASIPRAIDIRDGSVASPINTAGATVSISRTENITDPATCFSNPNGNTESCSALNVIVYSGTTQQQMSSGINSYVTQSGAGLYNAQAGNFLAEVNGASSTGYAEGAYIQARRATVGGKAWGTEIRMSNYGTNDCTASSISALPNCVVVMLGNDSPPAGRLKGGAGIMFENPFVTPFQEGIVFQQGTILNKTIWDGSSSTTSIQIDGTHTNAILIGATAGAIVAGSGASNLGYTLNIAGSGGSSNLGISVQNYSAGVVGGNIDFYKAHGGGSIISTGDAIGTIGSFGYDGAQYRQATSIVARASGTPASGVVPGQLEFNTANTVGTISRAMTLDNAQGMQLIGIAQMAGLMVGQTRNPVSSKLEVLGNIAAGTDINAKGNFGGSYITGVHFNYTYMGSSYFDATNWITNHDVFYGNNTVAEVVTDASGIKLFTQASTGNTTRTDAPATFDAYLRMRITPVGTVDIGKITDPASAPGAGQFRLLVAAGTNAGSCKLVSYAGTSTTPVTVIDNVGAGC